MPAFAYAVLTIGFVVGVLGLAFVIYIRISHYLLTYRAVRLMRRSGRFLSRTDFEHHLATSTGTVLFESPTLGFRVPPSMVDSRRCSCHRRYFGHLSKAPRLRGHHPIGLRGVVPQYLHGFASWPRIDCSVLHLWRCLPDDSIRHCEIDFHRCDRRKSGLLASRPSATVAQTE